MSYVIVGWRDKGRVKNTERSRIKSTTISNGEFKIIYFHRTYSIRTTTEYVIHTSLPTGLSLINTYVVFIHLLISVISTLLIF